MASFIKTSEDQTLEHSISKEAVIINNCEENTLQELYTTDEHLCLLSKVKPVDSVEEIDHYVPEFRHAGTQTDESDDNERCFELYDADTDYFMGIVTEQQLDEMLWNDELADNDASKKSLDYDEKTMTFVFSNNFSKSETSSTSNKTKTSKRTSRTKKVSKLTESPLPNTVLACNATSNCKAPSSLSDTATSYKDSLQPDKENGTFEPSTFANIVNEKLQDETSPFKKSSDFDEPSNSTKSVFPNKISKSKKKTRSKKATKPIASLLGNNFLAVEESSNLKGSIQLANVSTLEEPTAKIENGAKSSEFDETSNFTKSLFPNKVLESKASSVSNITSKSKTKSRSKRASKASSISKNYLAFEESLNLKGSSQLDNVSPLEETKAKIENDNEAESGKFNILNDNLKLEKECDIIRTPPETHSRPKIDGNQSETPLCLTASATLPPDTSNIASTLEEIITGIAFNNLPRCISAKIPESAKRKCTQPKELDMVEIVMGNKKEPPYITEFDTHVYKTENLNGCFTVVGYEDNLNPTDLPKPRSAIETIDRIENILEMVLTFGFNKTNETEDQLGNQILAGPVSNSMGLIREALEPIKSYIKSAVDTEFLRPFMNTVNNSINPTFYHLNDMKLALESPQTKNFTKLKLEKKKPNIMNLQQFTLNQRTFEISEMYQPKQIIYRSYQGNNQELSEKMCTQIFLQFKPIEPYHLTDDYQFMPYTTFIKFPWIPKGQFGINSLLSPEQGIIPPNQSDQNNISESVNQNQSTLVRTQVPVSDSAMIYHNPIITFRPARVNPLGIIEIEFKHNIQVVLTADLSVLVINKAEMMAAALSSDGYMAGLKFLYGECSLRGKTIKFASTNKTLDIQIRANFCEKGITFRGVKSANCYIITEAGLKKSKSIFSLLDKDFLGQIFYRCGRYGPTYVQECKELINYGKNEVLSDGSIYWYFRDMKVFQNARGTVTVHKDNFTYSVCMSPFHQVHSSYFNYMQMYAARVKTPCMHLTCSVGADDKHQVFIKQGRKREIFSSNEKFSVRNDNQYAGLNVETHEITSPSRQNQ